MENTKKVYVLTSRDGEMGNDEILGVYESQRSLAVGLSAYVAAAHEDESAEKMSAAVANVIFDMFAGSGDVDMVEDNGSIYGMEEHVMDSEEERE